MQDVRGVEFSVEKGEIMGIVGESGSGKSVTMKAVMGILPVNAKVEYDSLKLNGKELAGLSAEEYRKLRGKEMTMIFQDPMTALNPLKKIGSQARMDMEALLDAKVNLQLWVKVKKDWRDSEFLLKNYGYKEEDY